MIVVNGFRTDYAILKQVQQLVLAYPHMAIVQLGTEADFSGLSPGERLYLVSHGGTESLINPLVSREDLAKWLTDEKRGVPLGCKGGIILLSCYSGEKSSSGTSLAQFLADRLKGRAAKDMPVEGATGYSFGTPELQRSGYSNVVVHKTFNDATNLDEMTQEWLRLKPTHDLGVLRERLGTVDRSKTIEDQLATAQQDPGQAPKVIAQGYLSNFKTKATEIQNKLEGLLVSKIPGETVANRAAYLVKTDTAEAVGPWNDAIGQQYELFSSLYLWKSPADAFTVEHVP